MYTAFITPSPPQAIFFLTKKGPRVLCIVHFLPPKKQKTAKNGPRVLCIVHFLSPDIQKSGIHFYIIHIYKNNFKNRRERFAQSRDSDVFEQERDPNSPYNFLDARTHGRTEMNSSFGDPILPFPFHIFLAYTYVS